MAVFPGLDPGKTVKRFSGQESMPKQRGIAAKPPLLRPIWQERFRRAIF
jgi:hypothetical protein